MKNESGPKKLDQRLKQRAGKPGGVGGHLEGGWERQGRGGLKET